MSIRPKSTKLRFALITEAALDKLRPRSQSQHPKSKHLTDNEIYSTIHATVNELIERKLQSLNLDQIIEQKVLDIMERRKQTPATGTATDSTLSEDKFGFGDFVINSSHSSLHLKKRRTNRKKRPAEYSTVSKAKPPKSKLTRRIIEIPRPPSPPSAAVMKAIEAELNMKAELNKKAEAPSVLGLTAKYLQELDETHRRQAHSSESNL